MKQFVCVRLVKIEGVDLRLFEFDYDLTWYVFLLNGEDTVYGRYGGRDGKGADERQSIEGLAFAMEKALAAHKEGRMGVPRPAGPPVRATDFPAAKSHRGCIHCHNVKEFSRAQAQGLGKWDRQSLWVYPMPENIGITLDVNKGNRVEKVHPGSQAAKAGITPGASLEKLNGFTVASFADASYALHKAPWEGPLQLEWDEGGKKQKGIMQMEGGWKKTNFTWRPSVLDLLPSIPFQGEDLTEKEKKTMGLSAGSATFVQGTPVHPSLKAAGFQSGDVVVSADGATIQGAMGDFLGYLRKNYLVGDTVTFQILRHGKKLDVKLRLK